MDERQEPRERQGLFKLHGVFCLGCADAVMQKLEAQRAIWDVWLDWSTDTIHVIFMDDQITPSEIHQMIVATQCPHTVVPAQDPAPSAAGAARVRHLRHGIDMQPVGMGTKYDRMLYEMPAVLARAGAEPPPAYEATAHGEAEEHAQMHHDMGHSASAPSMVAAMEGDIRQRFYLALPLTFLTVLFSSLGFYLTGRRLPSFGIRPDWVMFVLSTPVVFYCGWIFLAGAFQSLWRRMLNMSVLIAIGMLAAYVSSVVLIFLGGETFFEAAAMLVTFVLFGHWLEMRSRRGTGAALRALFDLVPPQATVVRNGQEVTIPSAEVQVGDTIILRPGDKVPVDGEVIEGETSIDEALVTGESAPVRKRPGATVIAGSLNRTGSIRFRATRVGAETTVAQIVELVQRAQSSKAPGQRLADRAAQYLVLLAIGVGLLTFVVWFFIAHASLVTALTFAISAVVIACPDALGLATPTAVAVGTGVGARHGLLIKDAATLENISSISTVVLDKTGTLTEGQPALTDVVLVPGTNEQEFMRLVGAAEQSSEHPLADAIVAKAREHTAVFPDVTTFEALPGRGIRATTDGHTLLIGNLGLMLDEWIAVQPLEEQADGLAQAGRTPIYVAIDHQLTGVLAVSDQIKPSAVAAVRWLQEQKIDVVMLTGDTQKTAEIVAAELGIQHVIAGVLPADKAGYVQQLQHDGKRVAMVGDGINDAPALAQADIGIAIGVGADVAIETADIVLMRDDPMDLVRAIILSRATVRKMKENLVWASIYNVLAIPVAAGALYPWLGIELRPEWAALLMSASSIIVAVNAVALKRVARSLRLTTRERAPLPLRSTPTA